MEMIKGQHQGIIYVAWPRIHGGRLGITAQLMSDGKPFYTIEDGASVAGCAQGSMRGFAVAMVEMRINEEITLAKTGQHPAWRFIIPDILEKHDVHPIGSGSGKGAVKSG